MNFGGRTSRSYDFLGFFLHYQPVLSWHFLGYHPLRISYVSYPGILFRLFQIFQRLPQSLDLSNQLKNLPKSDNKKETVTEIKEVTESTGEHREKRKKKGPFLSCGDSAGMGQNPRYPFFVHMKIVGIYGCSSP